MLRSMKSFVAAVSLGCFSALSLAAPVSLGTITHNYGSNAGRVAPTSGGIFPGGCDTVNAASLTVNWSNSNGCNRFFDILDFSGLVYDSISSLVLTVNFASTNQTLETWRVRPASNQYNAVAATSANNLNSVGAGGGTKSFTFNSTNLGATDPYAPLNSASVFSNIEDSGKFYLWFSSAGILTNQNFTLFSASVEVFGTPTATNSVPTPGSLPLVALALLGAYTTHRARRKA